MLPVAVALLVGVGVGVAIGLAWWGRRNPPSTVVAEQVVDHDDIAGRLSEAVDHLEIGVVIWSASCAVVYRNAAARSTRGTHVGLLLDDQLASIIAEIGASERVRRVIELHGPPRSWLEVTADPMPDGGAVATIRDVSERVRTDAMRTDFVTNISHELKTPVGAVAVLAEALIDEDDPEVVNRLADHLVEESHRAVRTIDDLLKLSQIESTSPGDTAVDLTAVVRTAVAAAAPSTPDEASSSPRSTCPTSSGSTVTNSSWCRQSETSSRTRSSTAPRATVSRSGLVRTMWRSR